MTSCEGSIEIIAHRGFSEVAPENTLAALRAAVDAGARSFEWDVRVTACGTPILLHDSTLDRTTDGSGSVEKRTFQDLRSLDAGAWFSSRFRGEPLPSLQEALHAVREADRVYPEIKAAPNPEALEAMLYLVREAGLHERCTFLSLEHRLLRRLRAMDPTIGLGYVVEGEARLDHALEDVTGDPRALLVPDFRILLRHPDWTERTLRAGIALSTWTVDRTEDATRLEALGVRRITTNRVKTLLEWASEHASAHGPTEERPPARGEEG